MRTHSGRGGHGRGRKDVGGRWDRSTESEALAVPESMYWAPSVLSLRLVHLLLAFNNHHFLQFPPRLLGQCEYHQPSSSIVQHRPMHDDQQDVDGWDSFVHKSLASLAIKQTPW